MKDDRWKMTDEKWEMEDGGWEMKDDGHRAIDGRRQTTRQGAQNLGHGSI